MPPRCTHKVKLAGKAMCLDCYFAFYASPGYDLEKDDPRRREAWNFKLSSIEPEDRTLVGKKLRGKLDAPITAKGPGVELTNAKVSWEQSLDKIAVQLSTGTCTAICLQGNSFIVAENSIAPGLGEIKKQLGAVRDSSGATINHLVVLDRNGPRELLPGGGGVLQLNASGADGRDLVHAELRIVEYLHLTLPVVVAPHPKPYIYIGIDKGSCAKCETVMRAYNMWATGKFIAVNQGYHEMYNFEWRIPRGLAALKPQLNYRVLKNALT
jgi:hypothetical protein